MSGNLKILAKECFIFPDVRAIKNPIFEINFNLFIIIISVHDIQLNFVLMIQK